ncbi:MAG: beta-ketoacyl synthase N-terminal-like domain-containing protein, partial [Desulfobacterales bacterium]
GILVLKRLADAVADNDRIYCLIRGIGLSNDMHGNLLAPDTECQLRAMRSAYAAAGLPPEAVDLIECHGAGTPVGDATELRSLCRLWESAGAAPGCCALGSVKSMIGHLLTAAAAAGMIKVLLALNEKVLPPSLNFTTPPLDSPLTGSPFRVQTTAEPWPARADGTPRRAAVSGFGFGGINAHVLLEEWNKNTLKNYFKNSISQPGNGNGRQTPATEISAPARPVAMIGMALACGSISSLDEFQDIVFGGRNTVADPPATRWKGCEDLLRQSNVPLPSKGGFMLRLPIGITEFRIPPREIPDILPQHLLMLKVAATAMADAGLSEKVARPRMAVVIGLDFDFEATNFHLRWWLFEQVRQWRRHRYPELDDKAAAAWCAALQEVTGPPLTASRTLGALGSIVASRVAREFRCGGPSFTVSAADGGGLRALEIGVRLLQHQEADAVIVGAVDLAGDIRQILAGSTAGNFTRAEIIRPFGGGRGTLPADGAAAVVLVRRDQAVAAKNHTYAEVIGLGHAGGRTGEDAAADTHTRALKLALDDADTPADRIDFIETLGSGIAERDRAEVRALTTVFSGRSRPCPIGATLPGLGHSGAVAGLAAIVKTALCLHRKIIPPVPDFGEPGPEEWRRDVFQIPTTTQGWPAKANNERRRACVGVMTGDGDSYAVVLTETAPDLKSLSASSPRPSKSPAGEGRSPGETIEISIGGCVPIFCGPVRSDAHLAAGAAGEAPATAKLPLAPGETAAAAPAQNTDLRPPLFSRPKVTATTRRPAPEAGQPAPIPVNRVAMSPDPASSHVIAAFNDSTAATAAAHRRFIDFSIELGQAYAENAAGQVQLLEALAAAGQRTARSTAGLPLPTLPVRGVDAVAFTRDQCLEFATGRAATVLGPDFAVVDTYPTRVRLPDEPLMLVDRILSIAGRRRSLSAGHLVTEHDVRPGAWYLDGGRAPVCIAVEAGQADLFLCAYLGIDLAVKGRRVYRLLDAGVIFHRDLPLPGDTIRYRITIEKFIRQGETWLFFFGFEGAIDGQLLITMTGGCAGFFTPAEIENSGGIVRRPEDRAARSGRCDDRLTGFVPQAAAGFDEAALDALRSGDPAAAFGPAFDGITLPPALRLPGGRMKLIDRIERLEPRGGRFGLGSIRAEADIHPDDWFLTCHFVDDMTMPGTLMYECCAHALRVFLQRLGWVTELPDVHYAPVAGVKSILQCRGPVTPQTRRVIYEVEIKEIGCGPEPYALADAHMYADGRCIVRFTDMTLRMAGLDPESLAAFWRRRHRTEKPSGKKGQPRVLFTRHQLLTFATGNPSEAFGRPYEPFDKDRFLARLPAPPYAFIDRIVTAEPQAWQLAPGGWVEAELDIDPAAWYFRANRSDRLPYCVLLEVALQACGWLAAYLGSALHSRKDLHFRNLDGQAVQHLEVPAAPQTVRVRCRLTKVSRSGDIIIEAFEFKVLSGNRLVYEGTTVFGFFTAEALADQKGIPADSKQVHPSASDAQSEFTPETLDDMAPLTPADPNFSPAIGLSLPAKALRMIDRVEMHRPHGGRHQLGWLEASKRVDPAEWFFKAHFQHDPVCPGSLGIESLLQLLKVAAIRRWPHLVDGHRFEQPLGLAHSWQYRGQIVPGNRLVEVEAEITAATDGPTPELRADGLLKVDGLAIYRMKNYGVKITPL